MFEGLQEKFCKVEQDWFGAHGTDWNFSQNWAIELKKQIEMKKSKYFLSSVFEWGFWFYTPGVWCS
jgi:hypothetical protein